MVPLNVEKLNRLRKIGSGETAAGGAEGDTQKLSGKRIGSGRSSGKWGKPHAEGATEWGQAPYRESLRQRTEAQRAPWSAMRRFYFPAQDAQPILIIAGGIT